MREWRVRVQQPVDRSLLRLLYVEERGREKEKEEREGAGRREERGRDGERILINKTATNQPIGVTLNNTNPGGSVNSSTNLFFISLKKIAETNGAAEIREISIPAVGFSKNASVQGLNTITNYSAVLPNGAFLSVIVSKFYTLL
jgi:hypothetical protein